MCGPDPPHMVMVEEDSQEETAWLCQEVEKHRCVCLGILQSVCVSLCLRKGNFCSHPFRQKCSSFGRRLAWHQQNTPKWLCQTIVCNLYRSLAGEHPGSKCLGCSSGDVTHSCVVQGAHGSLCPQETM